MQFYVCDNELECCMGSGAVNPAGFPRDRDYTFLKSSGNGSLFCGNPAVAG